MLSRTSFKKVLKLCSLWARHDARYRLRLKSWDDFKRIPISHRESLKSFAGSQRLSAPFNMIATSGSTASKLVILHSREAYESHLGRLVKIYRSIGVKPGILCLNLCSYALNSPGRMMEAGLKAAGAGVIPFGPITSPAQAMDAAQMVKTLRPNMVNAYANQLYDLFAVIGRRHSLKIGLACGEPLWPQYRRNMEHMSGVKVHDHYGANEISALSVAIKPQDEYMKVFDDGLLLEVLDGSGKTSVLGQGDLVVTDLNNTCMPFLRYRLGDRVELVRQKGSLGIKVLGRIQESLLLNGAVVWKQELIKAVHDYLGKPGFFFVVDKHPLKYYDRVIINVAGATLPKASAVQAALVQRLGINFHVFLRAHPGEVPRTSNGKIKYFIDTRKSA